MYRRYYSYNDMPQLVRHDEPKEEVRKPCIEKTKVRPPKDNNIFANIENDDMILGIVLLSLLLDDSSDTLLLAVLAVIFFTG